ncbi:ThiF family adenylyltransferase [Rhodoferax sp. TS-BS-61-7]|uniref:tRNA threonylcarbamoyladenosine dehydratase n=1 Tax=Rhodoferax sp. TS-BS-61-7 TaxID=2094194 RepID=UPI000CF7004C|nr:tRNA threonylcarbamoyladenosine dehydratase [Rhodoferax sp. TS-BS-61-7]PQA78294.1 tRNA threonylcarbamoyladenosine dehydratase [Rhodoferax sp. TS-BS-61-7]
MTDSLESVDLARRFSGLDRLLGVAPADRVRLAHVMVVGIGGVGSWAAEALARSGVGRLTLVDMDHISESNINRQLHALSSTLGMSKIEAMRQRIALINPACDVHCLDTFADADNWASLVAGGVDAVLDACDQVRTKTAMAAWAVTTKTPFITVGAAGGKRLAHAVDIADLSETTHDPLLAQLRYRLRKEHSAPKNGKKMRVACVFSKEAVAGPDASCAVESDGSLNCHGYGSLVTVTATFGMCAAGWIIDKISRREQEEEKNTL